MPSFLIVGETLLRLPESQKGQGQYRRSIELTNQTRLRSICNRFLLLFNVTGLY